jgi:hypothetical protein
MSFRSSIGLKKDAAEDATAALSPFLLIPLEIRNMIYDLIIEESTIERDQKGNFTGDSGSDQISLQPPPPPWLLPVAFSEIPKPDLAIKSSKVSFAYLKLPSSLFFANHQIHHELSARIFSTFQHLQLTGDFLIGLQPTNSIFNLLEKRPWISAYTKFITVSLKLSGFVPIYGGLAVNESLLDEHSWLFPRLRISELNVQTFEITKRTWLQSCMKSCMDRLKYGKYNICSVLSHLGIPHPKSDEHNTLPDLAKVFSAFPRLEKIDIETESQTLLSLFPSPASTASSFQELGNRGIEVCLLLRDWQIEQFSNMLMKNGIERGNIRFLGLGPNKGQINLDFERDVAAGSFKDRVIRYRLLDAVIRPEAEVMAEREVSVFGTR